MKAISFFAILSLFISCSKPAAVKSDVLSSFYPMHVFSSALLQGSKISASIWLATAAGCPHEYAVTPDDMYKLSQTRLLVLNGVIDEFISDEKITAANPGIKILKSGTALMYLQEPSGVNEHIWISPRLAAAQIKIIADFFCENFPDQTIIIRSNLQQMHNDLALLENEIKTISAGFKRRPLIVMHGGFDYLLKELNLPPALNVNAGTGVKPQALDSLIKDAGIKSAAAVVSEKGESAELAERISSETGLPLIELDVISSGTDFEWISYLNRQKENIRLLQSVLN